MSYKTIFQNSKNVSLFCWIYIFDHFFVMKMIYCFWWPLYPCGPHFVCIPFTFLTMSLGVTSFVFTQVIGIRGWVYAPFVHIRFDFFSIRSYCIVWRTLCYFRNSAELFFNCSIKLLIAFMWNAELYRVIITYVSIYFRLWLWLLTLVSVCMNKLKVTVIWIWGGISHW